MSHKFLQEIYEKEKKHIKCFPTMIKNNRDSSYVSKRKLTQRTEKLFKSMSYSNNKPSEIKELDLLSIKSNGAKQITPQPYRKKIKMRNIRYVNGISQKDQPSYNEMKQAETKLLNPFQTSYEFHFKNQGKIKWIPKRYGTNKLEHEFSQNFYNNDCEKTPETLKDSDLTETEKLFQEIMYNKTEEPKELSTDQKTEKTKNNNEDDESTKKKTMEISETIEPKAKCAYNEVDEVEQSCNEVELKNLNPVAPLTKTEYFKILNIGYRHVKTHKIPLERLTEIIKENEEYFKHLAGICKCIKCTCGLHRCDFRLLKFSYNIPAQTSYQENYSKKPMSLYESPVVKPKNSNTLISDLRNDTDFVKESVSKSDFTNPNAVYNKPIFPHQTIEENPFIYKQSHYQREFLNYGTNTLVAPKVQQQKTVIGDLPFFGVTTYNQSFLNYSGKNARMNCTLPRIPFPLKNNTSKFESSTTNQREFQAYSMSPDRNNFKSTEDKIIEKIPISGQYKTTFGHDFLSIKRNECPFSTN